jgi:uncharacterized protein with HEPN domain
MRPEVLKFLHDIQQACELIEQFTAGKAVEEFRNDAQLRSAVERQFITIGEAIQQMLRIEPDLANSITDSRRVVNFRNVMVHGYAQVVADTVWGVVETGLPVLHAEVRQIIGRDAGAPPDARHDVH